MTAPLEVLALGALEDVTKIPGGSAVFRLPQVPDPAVTTSVFLANGLRVVGRGVVRNDENEIAECLGEQRFESVSKITAAVVNRKSDREPGTSGHLHKDRRSVVKRPLTTTASTSPDDVTNSVFTRHARVGLVLE